MDWLSNAPIWTADVSDFNGQWVPAVEVYEDELADDGAWSQKFLVHDNTPNGRYPVYRVGSVRADLHDPQTLIEEWKLVRDRDGDQDGPEGGD